MTTALPKKVLWVFGWVYREVSEKCDCYLIVSGRAEVQQGPQLYQKERKKGVRVRLGLE